MSSSPRDVEGPGAGGGAAPYVMRKLPHVTALFWVIKIVAVTIGETGSDEVATELGLGYLLSAVAFFLFFLVVLALQLRATRFRPPIFWAVVLATSIVGTAVSDLMDRGVGSTGKVTSGIGYGPGAVILVVLLGAIFLIWWRTGQTYDVERIATRKGETLYWVAILVSNTLGTASGDWLANDVGLGFNVTFLVIAAVMLVILAIYFTTDVNRMLLFWPAFVLTRPLSAAAGDSLTKDVDEGGLGTGPLWGTIILLVVLGALVAYQMTRLRREPLDLLPAPTHRVTGERQEPNGQLVLAHGPRPEQIVETR